jgi:GAF domain-containing protein/biotin carboxyl carrier protein
VESQQNPSAIPSGGEPVPGKATPGRGRRDGSLAEFLSGLLAATCRLGPAQAGVVLRQGSQTRSDASGVPHQEGNRIDVLAVHPELADSEEPPAWLRAAAQLAHDSIQANRPATAPWSGSQTPSSAFGVPSQDDGHRHILSIPMKLADLPSAAAAFLVQARDEAGLRAIRERLEMGLLLLTLSESRQALQKKELDLRRLHKAMETLSAVNSHRRFGSTAMALCNEAAAQWQCDRVSLGVLKGRYVQVKALSHTESFSRKMQVVQDLESAMEECLDQDCEVIHPASENSTYISRQTAELSKRHGPLALASLPIRYAQKVWGVLTLERPADRPFTADEVEAVRLALELCTARLAALQEHDRWIGAKLAAGLRDILALIVGPRHTWAKIIAFLAVAATLFLIFAKGNYRAEASFVLEGTQRQIVPAPFDGYLKTVNVEVSDAIRASETSLGELDTAELRLKLAEAKADRAGYLKQMDAAMRDGETAQAQIAEANAEKAQAQIDLFEYMIGQAKLLSPLSGTVVEGDLKRQIGAPVKMGDVLFEVTPLESLRAVLHVREDQITDVQVGQRGRLATASYPGQRIEFEVERVNPIAEVVKQKNVFKVRVRLLELYPWMRPGMEGVAKIDLAKRSYAWIWTRKIINWVRMKLWW